MLLKKITAIIIDDENDQGKLLECLLKNLQIVDVLVQTQVADEGIKAITKLNPDIVFLDIKMPGKDGFRVLDEIKNHPGISPEIIFTTAYEEFALKAFEYSAFSYLLKPIDPMRLFEVIERFQKHTSSNFISKTEKLISTLKKVVFKSHSGIIFIDPLEIVYCEADGNYTNIYLSNTKKEIVSINIGQLELQLKNYNFFRTSRSCLLNMTWLRKTDRRKCILEKNGETYTCDIAKDRVQELINLMQ